MGFPAKWKCWLLGILYAGSAMVLVNDPLHRAFHTKGAYIKRAHCPHFLFILEMTTLNVTMGKAAESSLFKGIQLPNNGPKISHLFYSDDVVFVGDRNMEYVNHLTRVMRCFLGIEFKGKSIEM
ncbi:hypothetical protein HanIR_Chr01g0002861 [Helianthus annuus]|nr:hypothetical protein HanIR_Chr01g0002861 [Helianthus annuus]